MRDSVDRHVELWQREHDWLDPLTEAIFARLHTLTRYAAQYRRETLAEGGLKLWQFKILLTLRRLGPPYTAGPSRLADLLGLTRGALSNRLVSLDEAGLITRTHPGGDRRRVEVRLTDAGYATFERHASTEGRSENRLLEPLTVEERQTLADLLRKLLIHAES
ncbi:DNA-binding MarR family transcriptional regulator [Actinoplanes tereljensis]|uniref:MarR family transcriptional regulator n=1 Tax=Paractinoplanes tereljensis TaxID=571912 RepID=A0A919TR45_9ACTN|nr:MarR family transcriptional regulator [Actinoplanes tereljensis]GIF19026.1 MarR family transcriptional regulator [Actinoplanes tereljensis]